MCAAVLMQIAVSFGFIIFGKYSYESFSFEMFFEFII